MWHNSLRESHRSIIYKTQFNVDGQGIHTNFGVYHTVWCWFFKFSSSFQNFKFTLDIISVLLDLQISHPSSEIGFTILSNKSLWHLTESFWTIKLLKTSYIARYALITNIFLIFTKLPVLTQVNPKDWNSLTILVQYYQNYHNFPLY